MLGKTCRNGVLTDYQHGFSPKQSTETQLVYTIHDKASANQSNKTIYDAILDFQEHLKKFLIADFWRKLIITEFVAHYLTGSNRF